MGTSFRCNDSWDSLPEWSGELWGIVLGLQNGGHDVMWKGCFGEVKISLLPLTGQGINTGMKSSSVPFSQVFPGILRNLVRKDDKVPQKIVKQMFEYFYRKSSKVEIKTTFINGISLNLQALVPRSDQLRCHRVSNLHNVSRFLYWLIQWRYQWRTAP